MLQLVGENIEALPFQGLKKVADLIEFEGPVLTHFKDEQGNNIFFYWVDYDNTHNRWLVFQVSNEQFDGYLSRKFSLKQVISEPVNGSLYTVDIDDMVGFHNVTKICKTDLDENYMPEEKSFYYS